MFYYVYYTLCACAYSIIFTLLRVDIYLAKQLYKSLDSKTEITKKKKNINKNEKLILCSTNYVMTVYVHIYVKNYIEK